MFACTGDAIYALTNADFPFTNPPIPTGSNPTPNPTTTPISTAPSGLTPTPSGSSTPASSRSPASASTTIANGGTTAGGYPTGATSKQEPLVFWIVGLGLLVLAAGASGVFLVLRKQARAARASATTTLPRSSEG